MVLMVVLMVLISVVFWVTRPSMALTVELIVVMSPVLAATCSFVANNCEPFTASLLVASSAPAFTFVTCTGVPALPSVTLS
ncbi:hypothetical protein AWB65_06949 [Caballeronia humi]|uniref:Uncharacterized protein n=1 Tax=Caballeronia humi TaxID=326474 RepID=A0A158JPX1_9BURK|nr:hypothetical protein AWB65_06949 [Caballeronia humi]